MTIRKIFRSKTILFGFAVTALGAIQTYLPYVQGVLDPATYGIATAVIGVSVVVLRFWTSKPLSEK